MKGEQGGESDRQRDPKKGRKRERERAAAAENMRLKCNVLERRREGGERKGGRNQGMSCS